MYVLKCSLLCYNKTASQNSAQNLDQWNQNPKNSIPNGRAHPYLIFLSKRGGVCFITGFFQLQKNFKEKAAAVQTFFFYFCINSEVHGRSIQTGKQCMDACLSFVWYPPLMRVCRVHHPTTFMRDTIIAFLWVSNGKKHLPYKCFLNSAPGGLFFWMSHCHLGHGGPY